MKKALVTGYAGFVGRHMTKHLENDGWQVWGVDPASGQPYDRVETFVFGESVTSSSQKFDLVIHAAAREPHRTAIDRRPMNFPHNVSLDALMFDWAVRTEQPRFVYLSSSAVYPAVRQTGNTHQRLHESFTNYNDGEPADSYGWTKLVGERMAFAARESGLDVTVVRPFSGYGEDQSNDFPFGKFVERAKAWQDPFAVWGSAMQVRDFIHIDDVCAGIMALVESDVTVANVCTGHGTALGDLALLVADAAGYHPALHIIKDAPLGVAYRVGDPTLFNTVYVPKISIEEGVARAFRGWKR